MASRHHWQAVGTARSAVVVEAVEGNLPVGNHSPPAVVLVVDNPAVAVVLVESSLRLADKPLVAVAVVVLAVPVVVA